MNVIEFTILVGFSLMMMLLMASCAVFTYKVWEDCDDPGPIILGALGEVLLLATWTFGGQYLIQYFYNH